MNLADYLCPPFVLLERSILRILGQTWAKMMGLRLAIYIPDLDNLYMGGINGAGERIRTSGLGIRSPHL